MRSVIHFSKSPVSPLSGRATTNGRRCVIHQSKDIVSGAGGALLGLTLGDSETDSELDGLTLGDSETDSELDGLTLGDSETDSDGLTLLLLDSYVTYRYAASTPASFCVFGLSNRSVAALILAQVSRMALTSVLTHPHAAGGPSPVEVLDSRLSKSSLATP